MSNPSGANIPNLLGVLVKSILKAALALIGIAMRMIGWVSNQISLVIQRIINHGSH